MKLVADDTQRMLRDSVRSFVRDRSPVSRLRQDIDGTELWGEMAELGWLALCASEADGGLELGLSELTVLLEGLGRTLCPEPLLTTALVVDALSRGPESLRGRIAAVAEGRLRVGFAGLEEGASERAPKILVAQGAGGPTLSGRKWQVQDARDADALLVSAGDGLYWVEPVPERHSLSRIDGRDASTIDFAATPATRVCDAAEVLDRATVALCADMLGAATQVFEDTLAYLKTREQFGVLIGSFQALQHRAGRCFTQLALARSAVVAAARVADEHPEQLPAMASMAKAKMSEVFVHVANEAVQMHGGIGMTEECDVGYYIKRARVCASLLGDAAWHRGRWAELKGY